MNRKMIKSAFYDDPEVLAMMEAKDREELVQKINETPNSEIALILKGDKGDAPTDEHLLSLIQPLIPEVEDGYTPKKGVDYFDGEPGTVGHTPTTSELQDLIKPLIPKAVEVAPVVTTTTIKEELTVDAKMVKMFIKVMRSLPMNDRIEITDIRNASSFMKDGIKYKIEELMHGGASTSTATTLKQETPTGTIDDSNTTFIVAHEPFYINVNGADYFVGTGSYSSYAAGTITLSSAVGTGGFIRSIYQA